jgi:hypothetical protein
MPAERDILELLQDFDGHGNTATERYTMRKTAYDEIKRLREQLAEARDAAEGYRLAACILGSVRK